MNINTYSAIIQKYKERVAHFSVMVEHLRKKYNQFAVIRLVTFFVGIGIGLVISDFGLTATVIYIILYLVGFGRFMIWHQGVASQRKHNEAMLKINENELKYAEGAFDDFDDGADFLEAAHPYAIDLDIFGKFSLFQYLNRASTILGKKRLADYFLNVPTFETIQKRQASAAELSEKLSWRQTFQAYGMNTEDSVLEIKALKTWLDEPSFVENNKALRTTLIVLPILTWIAIIMSFFLIPYQVAGVFAVVQLLILRRFFKRINEAHQYTAQVDKILEKYARIIEHVEKEEFETDKLKKLRSYFANEKGTASEALRQLSYRIGQLNVRYNIFAFVLSVTVMWDFQWVLKLEQWRTKHKALLPKWFEALEEFEAMNSLATALYNHPDWIFPTIKPNMETFEGEALGHPLLDRTKRISNNLTLPYKGHLKLITGSNMAGKSTFLRTVGLNIVLAMTGAPVCAKRFQLPLLEVYTSMRTQDALHESTSSFYAELKRLKVIIEAVESKSNVFFLLDEILKGTNSNDRHKGAKALILQLIKTQGMGIIATHDLDLGVLEKDNPRLIENLCMEVEVLEQSLVFDYTVKKGVSKSFNATYLMKNMGIKID